MGEARGNNPSYNRPRPLIKLIEGVSHRAAPYFVRSTFPEKKYPTFVRLTRLSAEPHVNVDTIDHLCTRLESLEYIQKSNILEP